MLSKSVADACYRGIVGISNSRTKLLYCYGRHLNDSKLVGVNEKETITNVHNA